jgi:cellobiose phosphorylase
MSCFDLQSASGLRLRLQAHGALHRIDGPDGLFINLFPGSVAEGGPAQLWLRRLDGETVQAIPLLGPQSPLRFALHEGSLRGQGLWQGVELELQLRLAAERPAWFWHLLLHNRSGQPLRLDWIAAQDVGLCAYDSARLNEHYVSQYIDLCPLDHPRHGPLLAARQNQQFKGRHPWLLMGSLRRAVGLATDGLQLHGLALRESGLPQGVARGLGNARQQHEHALLALQDGALNLLPDASASLGMGWLLQADHPEASQARDAALWDALLALPEAQALAPLQQAQPAPPAAAPSLFARSPWLAIEDLDETELDQLFGPDRLAAEHEQGRLLSFFSRDGQHVVLADKERRVLRPHGHLLRSGDHRVPDEAALTSTVWMGGVFHSMLTQGHVSFNRLLSTQRSYLGYQRSSGLRIFVGAGSGWQQLGLPSAFEMGEWHARWIYRHAGGLIEVRAEAFPDQPSRMQLRLRRLRGAALALRASLHLALAGDDGETALALRWADQSNGSLRLPMPAGSDLAARFPDGAFRLSPLPGGAALRPLDDGALYLDGKSRQQPFLCLDAQLDESWGLLIVGELIPPTPLAPSLRGPLPLPVLTPPAHSPLKQATQALAQILPWYRHNALMHYLAPRGLEQFNGGGWGTRDVCQGPLEMLLALGHTAPVRDLLCRVFAAQNPDGDWPQWFMFFERDAAVRAGDSHGDIVFWPLLGLARYLLASGDAGLLDEVLPFHGEVQALPLRSHVERALALIRRRVVPGTRLAAYWHGDWNDSLQPADPALRERLCSAWTVTLHQQTLATLAEAYALLGRESEAASLRLEAAAVADDFQALLLRDGVVAGYARFDSPGAAPELLLHPSDRETGQHYSLLPMMHGISNELFTPEQAQQHLALMQGPLQGVDGARLFDAPLAYRGGPETLFQRAETAAFFGREIGLMYTHAHLRYAESLAHLGQAQAFFDALQLAHPVALRERLPSADLRQANCYFSSSDAAFPDRYAASRDYAQALDGRCRLDGGWRVYSSGPGLAIAILIRHLLGWQLQARWVDLDPVLPAALDGLEVELWLGDSSLRLHYRVGALGHGVTALRLDGRELPFERQQNPYRTGAARLPCALLQGGRLLEVQLG